VKDRHNGRLPVARLNKEEKKKKQTTPTEIKTGREKHQVDETVLDVGMHQERKDPRKTERGFGRATKKKEKKREDVKKCSRNSHHNEEKRSGLCRPYLLQGRMTKRSGTSAPQWAKEKEVKKMLGRGRSKGENKGKAGAELIMTENRLKNRVREFAGKRVGGQTR